ncbi:hypothetical protein IWW52_001649 [Coemansia sp. RSA 2704]|nr:hypothetical protein IWW52_001649 [Coemansia sp. RSA 2704]
MLLSSFGSTSSANGAAIAPSVACGASTTIAESFIDSDRSLRSVDTSEDLCNRLDRAGGRRLDHQCAALPARPRQVSELGEILQRAGRLNAQRMSNQDFTPASVRRLERLERVSELAARPPGARMSSAQQEREPLLAGIASSLSGADLRGEERAGEHPRDHMRRVLFRSIDRLHRLGSPAMAANQRFHRPSAA